MASARRELPLFPLRTVLFPGTTIRLNVFEMRYREMMADVLSGDGLFGIALIRSGREVGGAAVPFPVGTVASIANLEQRPDGTMSFHAVGGQRFRILELLPGKPYLRASVEVLSEPASEVATELVAGARQAFFSYLEVATGLSGGWLHEMCERAEAPALSYLIAFYMRALPAVKQELLEVEGHQQRLEKELRLLQDETELLQHAPRTGPDRGSFNLN